MPPLTDIGDWEVEFYSDENGREPCEDRADGLSPQKRAAFTEAVRLVLAPRGPAVVETEFGKAPGDGLHELRVRWTAPEIRQKLGGLPPKEVGRRPEKILLRVFFCTAGRMVILLMSGYDKARDPVDRRQRREIARARLAEGLTERQLSKLSGVPQADISRIERGAGHPTEATLERIAVALGGKLGLVTA